MRKWFFLVGGAACGFLLAIYLKDVLLRSGDEHYPLFI